MTEPNFADNTFWTGDNLDILRGMNSECVDLIYLDPPFNSNRDYAAPIGSAAAGAAFKSMQSYLTMMAVRLLEMRRVLKDTGSIYLHCDPTASHYLKQLMDSVFGPGNYRNEISWNRANPKSLHTINFPNNRDTLLRYSKGDKATFHKIFVDHDPTYVAKAYKYTDEDGRRYRLLPLLNPNKDRPNLTYEFLGVTRVWRWTQERMQKAYEDGIVVQLKPGAVPQYKYYLEQSKGRTVTDDWDDIHQAAWERARSLPYAEAAGPTGAHHQGVLQRGRHGPRPLCRMRHDVRRRRAAGPAMGWNRPVAQGRRARQHATRKGDGQHIQRG